MNKKNNDKKFETVDIPEGTILESFKEYIKTHNCEDDIIKFLYTQNVKLFEKMGEYWSEEFPKSYQKELIDFYKYFTNNYYPEMRDTINNTFCGTPLILRIGYDYLQAWYVDTRNQILNSIPDNELGLKNAEELCKQILAIRKDKYLICGFKKEPLDDFMFVPGTIKKSNFNECRKDILCLCIRLILDGGIIIIKIPEKKGHEKILAVKNIDSHQTWEPISAEELKLVTEESINNHTTDTKTEYAEIKKEYRN